MLPNAGLNVYDVLRRETLILTKSALEGIGARFNPEKPAAEPKAAPKAKAAAKPAPKAKAAKPAKEAA